MDRAELREQEQIGIHLCPATLAEIAQVLAKAEEEE